jgi:hypothetical protein
MATKVHVASQPNLGENPSIGDQKYEVYSMQSLKVAGNSCDPLVSFFVLLRSSLFMSGSHGTVTYQVVLRK